MKRTHQDQSHQDTAVLRIWRKDGLPGASVMWSQVGPEASASCFLQHEDAISLPGVDLRPDRRGKAHVSPAADTQERLESPRMLDAQRRALDGSQVSPSVRKEISSKSSSVKPEHCFQASGRRCSLSLPPSALAGAAL